MSIEIIGIILGVLQALNFFVLRSMQEEIHKLRNDFTRHLESHITGRI